MNKKLLAAVSIVLITLLSTTLFGKVGVIVNKDLYPSISAAVTQYIADVQTIEGKDIRTRPLPCKMDDRPSAGLCMSIFQRRLENQWRPLAFGLSLGTRGSADGR